MLVQFLQITEFEDKGYAIGLSCTHMHADPTCAILFLKAWGDVHRRACIATPPFFHPPGLTPRPTPNLSTPSAHFLHRKSTHLSSPPPATTITSSPLMSSATFRFSDDSVKSILAELNSSFPDATPFDALASLFWLRIKHAGVDPPGHDSLTLCVDFRKSMHAPLPHGFYGNALHFSSVQADLGSSWGQVASALSRHVAGIEEEEYWSAIDWFGSKGTAEPFQMYGPELTCVKLDHVFAYGAVFEDGLKPVHVSCRLGGAEGEGVVMVMPAAGEGVARTVTVSLPAEVMEKVCKDRCCNTEART